MEITRALGIQLAIEVEGYEADDVIATWPRGCWRDQGAARWSSPPTRTWRSSCARTDERDDVGHGQGERDVDADGVREKFGVARTRSPTTWG